MIVGVMTNEERHAQMATAIGNGFPMLIKRRDGNYSDRRIQLVCYGPSLKATWNTIKRRGPIVTVSGAHDFLISHGITPDYHVDCDPRPHKAAMLTNPKNGIKYLMASCCHPDFWKVLQRKNVNLWHLINGDDLETVAWIHEHHPEGKSAMLGGGSTVGMRAMEVCAAKGFRRFDIYGMDCSFETDRHAGPHGGKQQLETLVRVGERQFKTTPQMLQAAQEMEKFILTMDADITFHGDGLMQETARFLKHPSNLKKVA